MLDTMPMHFTGWDVAWIALAMGWRYALAALVVLVLLGALVAKGWLRRTLWFGAGAIGTVYAVAALVVLGPMGLGKVNDARLARMRRPITRERTLAGATLPVGTVIDWVGTGQRDFWDVSLPGVSRVLGVPMTGAMRYEDDRLGPGFEQSRGRFWQGQLAKDTTIVSGRAGSWPCRAGDVALDEQEKLHRCTLAAARVFGGETVPGGSKIEVLEQEVLVTLAGAMAMAEMKGTFAAGNVVRFDDGGCVLGAAVYREAPVTVHGVTLWADDLRLHRDAGQGCGPVEWVRGNLKYARKDAEETLAGTEVDVNVATGTVRDVRVGDPE